MDIKAKYRFETAGRFMFTNHLPLCHVIFVFAQVSMHVHLLYQRLYELETIMVLKNFTTEVKSKRIWQLGTRHTTMCYNPC